MKMTEKLKDYQVLDVLCGGTFYKVRHKVTNKIFAWKAYNCSAYSGEQIQRVANEVKTISGASSGSLLRYYDTILHAPSKTLYFVLEHNCWRSVQELIAVCEAADKFVAETFVWHLLLELARVCKAVEDFHFDVLKKCITPQSIFVDESCELRVNCFELSASESDLMQQVGQVIHTLCYGAGTSDDKIKEFYYSDDLRDVVSLLTDNRNANLLPDVVLYHPTVLSNVEILSRPKCLNTILVSKDYSHQIYEANKCDSEKAVELGRVIKPAPRSHTNIVESPIYCNISPKKKKNIIIGESNSTRGSLSPTLAALALELPGYVPRSRKPYSEALDSYNCPQQVSEETLSQQWMSRLVALRQREESLNKRERELIGKEIVNSPAAKIIPLNDSKVTEKLSSESNGITLPQVLSQAEERDAWVTRRRHRRNGSARPKVRRKTYAYEDLDSSLSADAGDDSIVVTAAKFTKENMPRRNIFPDVSTKKVHFTPSNPFVESDESVTLTFYELGNIGDDGYQVPKQEEKVLKNINKFKYFDPEKATSEKRAAIDQWNHSSPSKQARITKKIFSDITNKGQSNMRKTPSKSSLLSRSLNTSRISIVSSKTQLSMESGSSKVSASNVSDRTRSSMRQSLLQTPVAPPDVKKSKSRKSLLPFKTPFKFMTSTKI